MQYLLHNITFLLVYCTNEAVCMCAYIIKDLILYTYLYLFWQCIVKPFHSETLMLSQFWDHFPERRGLSHFAQVSTSVLSHRPRNIPWARLSLAAISVLNGCHLEGLYAAASEKGQAQSRTHWVPHIAQYLHQWLEGIAPPVQVAFGVPVECLCQLMVG